MPKICKEKFNSTGFYVKERTTFSGDIELDLYYDPAKSRFYFEQRDLQKYFPKLEHMNIFSDCDTREKAVRIIKALINDNLKIVRCMEVMLHLPESIYMIDNPAYAIKLSTHSFSHVPDKIINPIFPDYLKDMLSKGRLYNIDAGIGITYKKMMRFENSEKTFYTSCDDNWNYDNDYITTITEGAIIDWTEEREEFLINMRNEIDVMCKKVLNFFNEDTIDKFMLKMENNKNLLKERNS